MRFRDSHRTAAAPSDPATQRDRDRVLAARVVAGDDRAFDVLVGHHRRRLVRLAAQIAPNGAAEDAVQVAMLGAYKALLRGVVPDDVSAWMSTLCRNAALDRVRRHTPVEPLAAAAAGGSASASTIAEARAELRDVLGAVASLPEDERDALMLRAVDGAGHDEIGLELGVTPGQARQLLYRARRRLREASLLVIPAWIPYRAEEAKAAAMRLFDPASGPLSSPLRAAAALATTAAVGTAGVVVAPVVLSPSPSGSSQQRAKAAHETGPSILGQTASSGGVRVVADADDSGRLRAVHGGAGSSASTDAHGDEAPDAAEPLDGSGPAGTSSPKPADASRPNPTASGSAPATDTAPTHHVAASASPGGVDEQRASTGTTAAPSREAAADTEEASSATEEPSSGRSTEPHEADKPDDIDEPDQPDQPDLETSDDDSSSAAEASGDDASELGRAGSLGSSPVEPLDE